MTRSIGDRRATEGPDPAIGAAIALVGVFLMGTAGARDGLVVFDAGLVAAVFGGAIFVLSIALSAMRPR